MADLDYKSNLRLIRDHWGEYRSVHGRKRPDRIPRLVLHTQRAYLVAICHYPNKKMTSKPMYRPLNWFFLCNQALMFTAMACAVHESTNIIDMGDDLVWLIGVALIWTKSYFVHEHANDIDEIIRDFAYYDEVVRPNHDDDEILECQSYVYIIESYINIIYFVLVHMFSIAICLQPLFGEGRLPYHVLMPFDWHRHDLHPWAHWVVYVWLSLSSHHNLFTILHVEMVGFCTVIQTALNLKLLGIELRKLGDLKSLSDYQFHIEFRRVIRYHQHIINLVDKVNRAFYAPFIAQMMASFAMISITTFETMVAAKTDPRMALKFVIFTMIVFLQLSSWCTAGSYVLHLSTEIAQEVFAISDWHTKSVQIQRDLGFIILRAQKPLVFVAEPFMPYTLGTYMIVLKQCYTLLAVLRESM
ncbi:odorant receptor 47b [Drosophila guanche]|uniref:Odorant receptor n=1 Tax=Drosophila guanche TaxID=7266 RepID=A0A3B0JMY9_DROGU|nr:odorant receptor 47b [Drosophila guanche]SPP74001.1 blast:Odorant receptor 47b [Drosophila guanche]